MTLCQFDKIHSLLRIYIETYKVAAVQSKSPIITNGRLGNATCSGVMALLNKPNL